MKSVETHENSLANEDLAELKAKLGDREWRLDHLYWIKDAAGNAIRFVRNEPQMALWHNLWYLNAILKARQLGFSTFIAIVQLDSCMFDEHTSGGIIDYTLPDAKNKLDKIAFAYGRLPQLVQKLVPLVKKNTEEIEFANGSSIRVGTSHRGGTLQFLHVSEFGKISAMFPDKAREIKTGAFGTVHAGQFLYVESTAEGMGGEFHDLIKRASDLQKQGRKLSQLDFHLHFFAWWRHDKYRQDPETVMIPLELADYFDELKGKYGIVLDAEQKAWYAAKRYQIGPDEIFREYPSIPEEAFKASVEGAYFRNEMSQARLDGRIGAVPHDPNYSVNTFWDIGMDDQNVIWFHQYDGLRHRLIDYHSNSGESLPYYANIIKKRAETLGYNYGTHYGPHDLEVRDWSSETAKPRVEIAKDLGIVFQVVPRVAEKADAIAAARKFLGMCWIDERRCEAGIKGLDNYRKQWDERNATFRATPVHNDYSHGADALMTGAIGYDPDLDPKKKQRRRRYSPMRITSAWAV